MTKYLLSFPSGAMDIADGDLQAVSDAAHAVVEEAWAAGVWVFGGGIDEGAPPVGDDGPRPAQATSLQVSQQLGDGNGLPRPCLWLHWMSSHTHA